MVRLKGADAAPQYTSEYLFQFQYGAIKSIFIDSFTYLNWEFQFQYGAIKSQYFIAVEKLMQYFNSNMVRLKALTLTDNEL